MLKIAFLDVKIQFIIKENYTSRKATKWLEEEIIEKVEETKNEE